MTRAWTLVLALVASMALAANAHAQQPAQGGAEMWDLSNPAAPRHWFSGLRCWDQAAGAPFSQRTAYDVIGGDVSCGYGARDNDVFVTVYATLRRPIGAPFQEVVTATAQAVRSRYEEPETLAEGVRDLQTARGTLPMHELILSVKGHDSVARREIRATTGVWHVDIAGWTLKLRLTGGAHREPAFMREAADVIMRRAVEDMDTARACANTGSAEAPALQLDQEAMLNVSIMASLIAPTLRESVPRNPVAARAAGYVCLGEAMQTRNNGPLVTAVMQTPSAAPPASREQSAINLLALGEVRNGAENPPMVAVFDMSLNPLELPNYRSDRAHLLFVFDGDTTGFIGLAGNPPRSSGAAGAEYVASGGAPRISTTTRPQSQGSSPEKRDGN